MLVDKFTNLALPLHNLGYPIVGTSPLDIDNAEDRAKFSSMLNELNIDQPSWINAKSSEEVQTYRRSWFASSDSSVLCTLRCGDESSLRSKTLTNYLNEAVLISNDHPQ